MNTKEYNKQYREKHRDKLIKYGREYRLKNQEALKKKQAIIRQRDKVKRTICKIRCQFKITQELAEHLYYKRMDGVCSICGKRETAKGLSLSIDHNHRTGKIRGLLCGKCNKGLGGFKDKPQLLLKAVKYLQERNSGKYYQ